MADQIQPQEVPPLPPTGQVVTSGALYNSQIANYRNTLAYGGTRNPSDIWLQMNRNDSTSILYYRELEAKDADVANALQTLKLTVLERDHSIVPFDDSGPAQDVQRFIEDQLFSLPHLYNILDNLLDAPGYGFSLGEMEFDVSSGQASLLDIKDCPQELFLFGDRFQPQIGPLQFLSYPQASNGVLVPESKFVIFSYRPRSRDRMGRPLLRDIFWPSWIKRNAERLWLRYAEKGPGTAVTRFKDGGSPQDRAQAAQDALALIEEVAVAVPEGFQYEAELLKSTRSMDPSVYEHLVEAKQLDIVRLVLGETLTSFGGDKGKGTQALGEVHSDTLEKRSIGLCKSFASVINTQIVRPLVLWNFGPNAPMPRWKYETEQEEDLDRRLDRDMNVQKMGLSIPESYLRAKYEIPAPVDGEPVVTPQAGAQTVAVPIPSTDTTFAETSATHEAQAERDLAQFDRLVGQLQKESLGLLSQRVREIDESVR